MASELKRCDCGSEADCDRYGTTGYYSICRNPSCGAQTALYRRKYQAVAAWNRRAPFTVSGLSVVGAASEIAELRGDLDPLVYDKASQVITLMIREAGGEVTDE